MDSWKLFYRNNQDFDALVKKWKQVIDILLPFHAILEIALIGGLKSKETSKNAVMQLRAIISSLGTVYSMQLQGFVESINTDM